MTVAFGGPAETGGFDVVVVGGGITGWIAARRSQQLGASVALLERGPTGPGWGSLQNATMAQGRIHASYLNPLLHTPDELYAQLWKKTDGQVSPEVVRAWAENARRGLEFVLAEGGQVIAVGAPEYMQLALTNVPINAKIMETFREQGGTFRAHARCVKLEMRDGAVAGIWYEQPDGSRHLVHARTVILACSGFQANRALVERYITRHAYRVIDSNGANQYAVGDGLQMALDVGAKLVQLDSLYDSLVTIGPDPKDPTKPTLLPYLATSWDQTATQITFHLRKDATKPLTIQMRATPVVHGAGGEFLQAQWEKAGITVNAQITDFNTFVQGLAKHDFDAFLITWPADVPSPNVSIASYLGPTSSGEVKDTEAEAALAAARKAEGAERCKQWGLVQRASCSTGTCCQRRRRRPTSSAGASTSFPAASISAFSSCEKLRQRSRVANYARAAVAAGWRLEYDHSPKRLTLFSASGSETGRPCSCGPLVWRWQATRPPPSTGVSDGISSRQICMANGQRGWKGQPDGGASGPGGSP